MSILRRTNSKNDMTCSRQLHKCLDHKKKEKEMKNRERTELQLALSTLHNLLTEL